MQRSIWLECPLEALEVMEIIIVMPIVLADLVVLKWI
jgi:hypothetical protein